jgi:hypothetical protein
MSIVPVFKNNIETSSILANSTIHMMEEVSDLQKSYVNTPASVINEVSASFQNPNLNNWIQGEVELVFQRTIQFKGKTFAPVINQGVAGTSPFLWNPSNSTFDGFCLNKLINEIKFSISNKQFTEVDRQNPEMIDMFALQFDQDELKSYGIYGEDGIKNSTNHNQNFVNGSDLFRPQEIVGMGEYIGGLIGGGLSTSIQGERSMKLQPWQQNTKGYVKVISNSYALASTPNTPLFTNDALDGYEGIAVPVTASGGSTISYTADADFLLQTVVLEIHEFIISPNLSNPYSKNKNKKVYFAGGYPFNLSLTFNQDYAKSMFKWKASGRQAVSGLTNGTAVINSESWTRAEMRFWTFDSSKPLPSEPIQTIYYKQQVETPAIRKFDPTTTTAKDQVSTSNLAVLPNYVFIYAIARASSNPSWFTERRNNPYCELLPINSVNVRIGTQADTLASMDLYKDELVRHTLLTLGNPEFRNLIASEENVLEFGDLGQIQAAFNSPPLAVDIAQSQASIAPKRGLPFYILDINKLNLRSADGLNLPYLAGVNYGSTSFRAITISMEYEGTREMRKSLNVFSSNTLLTAEMNVVLMNKRVRTLPLLSGNMTDDEVQYRIEDISAELMQFIRNGYQSSGDNQLSYVGGSFLGSVWDSVKDYLKHPALRMAAKISRGVRDATANEENEILRGMNAVSSGASRMADIAGLGRKTRYSKV